MKIIKRENGFLVILNINGVKVEFSAISQKEAFEKVGKILKM